MGINFATTPILMPNLILFKFAITLSIIINRFTPFFLMTGSFCELWNLKVTPDKYRVGKVIEYLRSQLFFLFFYEIVNRDRVVRVLMLVNLLCLESCHM